MDKQSSLQLKAQRNHPSRYALILGRLRIERRVELSAQSSLNGQRRDHAIMATDDPRCPYCVDEYVFRGLTQNGDLWICKTCLHVLSPLDPKFVCKCSNCRKCQQFSEAVADPELSASIASLDREIRSRKSQSTGKATMRRHA